MVHRFRGVALGVAALLLGIAAGPALCGCPPTTTLPPSALALPHATHIECERRTFDFLRHALGCFTVHIGHQQAGAISCEAAADGRADGATASCDEDRPHFGRLSITRFALPMERSIVPTRTSALTPM